MSRENPNVSSRMVKHSANVDMDGITGLFSKGGEKHRYLLTVPFKAEPTRNKVLSVILKNPSSAEEERADTTVNRVENYVYKNFPDVAEINILNLYSYRATDAADLQTFIDERPRIHQIAQSRNDRVIKSTVENSDYIIVAWGGHTDVDKDEYKSRVEEIIEMLDQNGIADKAYEVMKPKKERGEFVNTTPLHGQVWGYQWPNENYFHSSN